MINNRQITLGSQVWANLEATDPNLVVAWCRHYKAIDYIDNFIIRLQYNIEKENDAIYFKNLYKKELPKLSRIVIDHVPYTTSGMNYFHNNNLKTTDIYIPRDVDEFIDFNVLTDSVVQDFVANNYNCIMGFTRDRICLTDDNRPLLTDVSMWEPLELQFPMTQDRYGVKLRQPLKKIIMIKQLFLYDDVEIGYNYIRGGGAHAYGTQITNQQYENQRLTYIHNIPVDHYCWLKSSLYNRKQRTNSQSAGYKRINNSIKEHFLIDEVNKYSRILIR